MLTEYLDKSAVSEIVKSVTDVFGVPLAIANLDGSFLCTSENWAVHKHFQAPELIRSLVKMATGDNLPVVNASTALPLAVLPLKFAGEDCAYGIIDLTKTNYANEEETKKFLGSITKSLNDLSIYASWAADKQVNEIKLETRAKVKEFQEGRVSHQDVINQILHGLLSLTLGDVAVIALTDEKMESLQPEYVAGDSELVPDCFQQCRLGWWTLHTKQPFVLTDPMSDARCKRGTFENGVKRAGFWPLFNREKTFGVLLIASRKAGNSQYQKEYIDNLILNLSFVLEDQDRKRQVSDITKKINAFNEIGKILNSSLDLNKVLDLIADMSMNIFGNGTCCVYLKNRESVADLMVARGVKNEEISYLARRFHQGFDKAGNYDLLDFPILVKDKTIGYLSMGSFPPGKPSAGDCELIKTFTHMAGIAVQNSQMFEETKQTLLETITVLSLAIEARDKTMFGHSEKVREFAVAIAEAKGLRVDQVSIIESAGLLHDIGKLGIPEATLNKEGSLTAHEYEDFKKHPVIGADILKAVRSFEVIGTLVKHHHERFDGQGYPDGLQGEQIPLGSRILAIADTFASLVSNRSFRAAKDPYEALEIVKSNAGKQFDPDLVNVFEKIVRQRYSLKIEFRCAESAAASEPGLLASEIGLTDREAEILAHISAGLNNKEIARLLYLSEKTVKTHVTHILKKLNLPDRTKAAIFAIQKGMVKQVNV